MLYIVEVKMPYAKLVSTFKVFVYLTFLLFLSFSNLFSLLLSFSTNSLGVLLIPRAASLRNASNPACLPGCAAKLDTEIGDKMMVVPDGWR